MSERGPSPAAAGAGLSPAGRPGSHGRDRRQQGGEAIEDYAKAIYALAQKTDGSVGTNAIADRLGVSAGSVTPMLKRMAKLGLLTREPYQGVELTEAGRRVALEVIRHHRLIEAYLSEALGMPWDRVHDEAEVLEHYISEELEERMAAALGHPDRDPHGDPIPDRELAVERDAGVSLDAMEPGEAGVFTRVSDGQPEMLRYLAEREIRPGVRITLTDRQPFGGPLTVTIGDREHALGEGLAQRMVIAPDNAE